MARLEDAGRSLEMVLEGYQVADVSTLDNDYDANWVDVRVRARDEGQDWEAVAPAFLTWELLELSDWLDAYADADQGQMFFSGFEPYLQFEGDAGARSLVAVFARDFLPPGVDRKTDEHAVRFSVDAAGARRLAREVAAESEAVPVRVVQADGYAAAVIEQRKPKGETKPVE